MQKNNHQVSSREILNPKHVHKNTDRYIKCGDSAHQEGFQCPAKKFQCNHATNFINLQASVTKEPQHKQVSFKARKSKAHQLQAGTLYVQDSALCSQSEDFSSEDSFCLHLKIQCIQAGIKNIPPPAHLITNLAYR